MRRARERAFIVSCGITRPLAAAKRNVRHLCSAALSANTQPKALNGLLRGSSNTPWWCFRRYRKPYKPDIYLTDQVKAVCEEIKQAIHENGPVCSADLDFPDTIMVFCKTATAHLPWRWILSSRGAGKSRERVFLLPAVTQPSLGYATLHKA